MTQQAPVLLAFPSSAELVDALSTFIITAQKEAIEKKGRFAVAISGGSLPKQLNGLIDKPGVKWDKWSESTCRNRSITTAHLIDDTQASLLR
jgi:6-phosphogluconolactonase